MTSGEWIQYSLVRRMIGARMLATRPAMEHRPTPIALTEKLKKKKKTSDIPYFDLSPGRGGGGSGSSSSVKCWAPERARGARVWKCGAPERARGAARAWKCGSPELTVGCVWLALWPAANPGAPRQSEKRGLRSELEWLECKSAGLRSELGELGWVLKAGRGQRNFENYGLRNGKKIKMVMLRSGIFWHWWNDMLRTGNLGLKIGVSRAAHTQYALYGSTPPPPPH